MTDLSIETTHDLCRRDSEKKGSRLGRARRIALAVQRSAREWHQASEGEWLARAERPFGRVGDTL
jgi:hypothetical protein